MKEREPNLYWQHDILLDLSRVHPHPDVPVWLRVHESTEPYRLGAREIIPLTAPRGQRRYFQGQPYTLAADLSLTVDPFPRSGPANEIGAVAESIFSGLRHLPMGSMQAWSYPADEGLILWEVSLYDRYRTEPPIEDGLLGALWQKWEQFLLRRCPEAQFIATPRDEPDYHPEHWQEFLEAQGYRPLNDRAFVKEVLTR